MKLRLWLVILGISLASLLGIWRMNVATEKMGGLDFQEERASDRDSRWTQEARSALDAEVRKVLVGYSRTIETHEIFYDPSPRKWKANVIAEFVNKVGGIERTNLQFAFSLSSFDTRKHVYCKIDVEWEIKQRQQEYEAWKKSLGSK